MTDEERDMLELIWENFFPLMDEVADALDHLRVLNWTIEALGERMRRLEDIAGPTMH